MKTFVCIDDTDNLESRGTGALASLMIEHIENRNWGKCSYVSRHQLYYHPDVPFTSHNSTMCFEIEHEKDIYENLKNYAFDFLQKECAEGSDPGLCIAKYDDIKNDDEIIKMLMEYGKRAKKEILTKEISYDTAKKTGVHLSEHGGTGGGVIGALAGIGLRLTGNDGRIKGKLYFPFNKNILTVEEILNNSDVDEIRSLDGKILNKNENIKLGEKVKAVYLDFKKVLLVYKDSNESDGENCYHTCIKEQLKVY